MNSITAGGTEGARIPAVLPNDERTVLRAMVATCWRSDPEERQGLPDPLDPASWVRSWSHRPCYEEVEGRSDVERLCAAAAAGVLAPTATC